MMVKSWECLVWVLEPKTTIKIKKPKKSYYSYYSLSTFLILFHPSNLYKKSSKIYLTLVQLVGSLRINGRIYPWLELEVLILISWLKKKSRMEGLGREEMFLCLLPWLLLGNEVVIYFYLIDIPQYLSQDLIFVANLGDKSSQHWQVTS